VLKLCRWGQAEYETEPLAGLPEGVALVGDEREAEVLVVPSTRRVTAADVPRARLVITSTSGFDNLDLPSLRAAGVRCARLPLARRDAVVETALGMILSLARRIAPMQAAAREGRWERARLHEWRATLLGRVGIVGMGVIGTRMAEVLTALGAEVVPCRRGDRIPTDVDVLTLHCSLDEHNVRMVDRDLLARLRPRAVLVNTARGKLVDVDAAMDAVRSGRLAGLGLDVFPREPADLAALAHPAVLVTPHAAGWHPGLGRAIAEGVATAVRAYLAGVAVPWEVGGRL
jgi:phosphoglycerate dehydrogenase-like enzyme